MSGKRLRIATLLTLSFLALSSCAKENPVSSASSEGSSSLGSSRQEGSSSEESSSARESTSSLSSSESSYEKGEDGFMVLPDDYFAYQDQEEVGERGKAYIPPLCEGMPTHGKMRLFCHGQSVPVYVVKTNLRNAFDSIGSYRRDDAVASLYIEGKVHLSLQLNFNSSTRMDVYPKSLGVHPTFSSASRVMDFDIASPGQYVIELFGGLTLHLFVEDLSALPRNESSYLYFGPGIHSHENDSRIGSDHYVHLSSNQTVYLAPGAVVRGGFAAYQASNVKVIGPGYIDGSVFTRNANTNERMIPLDFDYCTNVALRDFSVLDPAGWTFNMYFDNQVTIHNCKIISSRANGDGISLQSCQNVEVDHCFTRCWDDALVVKNYPKWSDASQEGTTRHIHFSKCLIYSDLAQCMEIGYETVGQVMEDITFEDIDVIRAGHLAVFSIHNGNNAAIKEVTYRNITVERAPLAQGSHLLDFSTAYSSTWSDGHKVTALGSVDGVKMENILVEDCRAGADLSIKGALETRAAYPREPHYIDNVDIKDFSWKGEILSSGNEGISTNEYVRGLTISSSGNAITGAALDVADASSYGPNFDLTDF